jgi:hypothetical protein
MSTLYPDIVGTLFLPGAVSRAPKHQNLRCNVKQAQYFSLPFTSMLVQQQKFCLRPLRKLRDIFFE